MGPSTLEEMSDSLMASKRRFVTWGRHNATLLVTGVALAAAVSCAGSIQSVFRLSEA